MGAFLRFAQTVLGAAYNHLVAVFHKCHKYILKAQQLGTSVDECHVVYGKRSLHLCHLVELVEHYV